MRWPWLRRGPQEPAVYVQDDADLPIVRVGPRLKRLDLGDPDLVTWEPDEEWYEATCSVHGTLGQGHPSGREQLGAVAREHSALVHHGNVQVRGWMV